MWDCLAKWPKPTEPRLRKHWSTGALPKGRLPHEEVGTGSGHFHLTVSALRWLSLSLGRALFASRLAQGAVAEAVDADALGQGGPQGGQVGVCGEVHRLR